MWIRKFQGLLDSAALQESRAPKSNKQCKHSVISACSHVVSETDSVILYKRMREGERESVSDNSVQTLFC